MQNNLRIKIKKDGKEVEVLIPPKVQRRLKSNISHQIINPDSMVSKLILTDEYQSLEPEKKADVFLTELEKAKNETFTKFTRIVAKKVLMASQHYLEGKTASQAGLGSSSTALSWIEKFDHLDPTVDPAPKHIFAMKAFVGRLFKKGDNNVSNLVKEEGFQEKAHKEKVALFLNAFEKDTGVTMNKITKSVCARVINTSPHWLEGKSSKAPKQSDFGSMFDEFI